MTTMAIAADGGRPPFLPVLMSASRREESRFEPVIGPTPALQLHIPEDDESCLCGQAMTPRRLWRRWGLSYAADELEWAANGTVCRECIKRARGPRLR